MSKKKTHAKKSEKVEEKPKSDFAYQIAFKIEQIDSKIKDLKLERKELIKAYKALDKLNL